MSGYVPEEGSLSAALLAEVANGQARDLKAARSELAALRSENDNLGDDVAEALAELDAARDEIERLRAEAGNDAQRIEAAEHLNRVFMDRLAALDAAPAAKTGSGEA